MTVARTNIAATPRESDWLIPASAILAVELLLWFLSYSAGFAQSPQITAYGLVAYSCMTLVLAYHCLVLLYRTRGQPPLKTIMRTAFSDWRRVAFLFVGLQIVALGSSAFGALKAAMPKTVPFWLDQPLYSGEAELFGAPPWQLTQHFLGWATPAIEVVYSTFVPSHLAAMFAVVLLKPSPLKTRALISLFLIWLLLGIVAAYALSSAGPIFYDRVYGGDLVAGLNQTLRDAPIAVRTADSLWMLHQLSTPAIGNGLSAMPSMHVALTLWLALLLRETRVAPIAWIYFGLIWLGSVHLGWHYVSDGLVASVGVLCIWRLLRPGPAISPIANRQASGIVFGPA